MSNNYSELQYYANQTAAAFVDNLFESFLKLHSCVCRHPEQLVVKSFVYKLMQRFSENI